VEPIERRLFCFEANVRVVLQHSAREVPGDRLDHMVRLLEIGRVEGVGAPLRK
jgi:hypothetical protein